MTEETVSLKEYLQDRINDVKDSVKLAYASMEKRLESMNEFRDTLRDQASRFITRDELDLIVKRVETDIKNLQLAKAVLEGKASQQSVNLALLISVIGIVIGLVGLIMNFVRN